MTIYKYPLSVTGSQIIELPRGATILTAQVQGEMLCLWAEIDENQEDTDERIIGVFGTGHPMGNTPRRYINTTQADGGSLIWHVFELLTTPVQRA